MKSRLIGDKKIFGQELSLPNAYGTTVLICLGLGLGTLVLQVLVVMGMFLVARKSPPVLVQTVSGESLSVRGIGGDERDSVAIKRFTGEILTLMLSWSGYLPPETVQDTTTPKLDQGIKLRVEGDNTDYLLPTQSWEASFALEPQFRQEFLPKLAKFVPDSVFQGRSTVFYVPQMVGEPKKLGQGRWKLEVIGTLFVISDDNQLGTLIKFNRTVYVRAITPMFAQGIPRESKYPQLASKVAQFRQAALEIYAMTDLQEQEIGE